METLEARTRINGTIVKRLPGVLVILPKKQYTIHPMTIKVRVKPFEDYSPEEKVACCNPGCDAQIEFRDSANDGTRILCRDCYNSINNDF